MKTYLRKYETVDIKGYLDFNEDEGYFVSYENSAKETCNVMVDDLLKEMIGNAVQFKTITE